MQFDILDKMVMVCARRGSGKSELVKYLFNKYKNQFDQYFIFSGTEFSGFWNKAGAEPKNIFTDYDEQWVLKLLNRLEVENEGKTKSSEGFKHVLLILDDILASKRSHDFKTLDTLATKGRHYGIACIYISQMWRRCSPTLRVNSDYVFFGKNNRASVELLEEEMNTSMPKKEFIQLVDKSTNDFYFFVIDQTSSDTSDLNRTFGKFKVPNV